MHIILATARTHPELTPSDALLRDELEACGVRVTAAPWDTISTDPADASLVVLRSTWDYHHRHEEFQRWLAAWIHRPTSLCNPPETVLWNLDKIYLRDLAEGGIALPLTRWFEPGQRPDVDGFLAESVLTAAVVKPRISATAWGTRLVRTGVELSDTDTEPLLAVGSILQAFVPEIQTRGELSLMFIADRFSHAVIKRPAAGDFRVQSEFGGSAAPCSVSDRARAFGEAVVAAVRHPWLYARVDIVETGQGPVLMELELIEPALFLDAAPGAAARLAEEVMRLAQGTSALRAKQDIHEPTEVGTSETVEFVQAHVSPPASILEIGCGLGHVAAELSRLGYAVTGVDAGIEEVEATRSKGVSAIVGRWPNVSAPSADAVLFTRSLHHIGDLTGALHAAYKTLAGARLLLIEDFDFVAADGGTVHWLLRKFKEAGSRSLLQGDGHRSDDGDPFVLRLASAANPLDAWRADHDHDLHSADAILSALTERFQIVARQAVPYAYRYLVPVLQPTSRAAAWLHEAFRDERAQGNAGRLTLIGRRIAAGLP
ncbi:MAG: methyltransferase domain-containing protein [Gemmatimonadota bacterium]